MAAARVQVSSSNQISDLRPDGPIRAGYRPGGGGAPPGGHTGSCVSQNHTEMKKVPVMLTSRPLLLAISFAFQFPLSGI